MKNIFVFISLFTFTSILSGQEVDSLSTPFLNDSSSVAIADSVTVADTLTQRDKADVDAIIFTSGSDSLSFNIKKKEMNIYGNGELKYKRTDLKSGKIRVDLNTSDLYAEGVIDTADTNGLAIVQTPELTEAGEKYEGSSIRYNFKTQRGFISMAKNTGADKSYRGAKVKKVEKDIFFVEDGIYTTCDADEPHTHFQASEMKVIHKDKIFAKWIFLYIGGVPFPVPLPFAVFPNESGRRSGIIPPVYGSIADRGQYFKNFGYFFALSDYFDLSLTGDYYTKGGYGLRSRFRYAKRYDFNGNINAGYSNITIGEDGDPNQSIRKDWNLSVYHNQTFDPTMSLTVNLQFQSSTYMQNNSVSYNDLLQKDIVSNATLTKRWDESGNSMTVNYSRSQNLETGNINEILPSISFNMPVSYPFRKGSGASADQKWYEYIGYSYNGQFQNTREKTEGDLKIRGGIKHNISLSASPKAGYINISPKMNYSERWYNKRIEQESIQLQEVNSTTGEVTYRDSIATHDINEINFVRTFDFSLSASTKLYGMWQANMLGIEAFRHTLTPSITYNYTPDFSEEQWGYYDSYTTSDGDEVKYSKYKNEVFGGPSSGERQSINFSLGNLFEMKTQNDPTDTTSEAQKIQLLNLSAGVGYNFAADSLKLSDLSVSYRTQIGSLLNLSGSSSFTFYDFENGHKINRYLSSAGKGLLRMTNFQFSVSTSLSGDKLKGEEEEGKSRLKPEDEEDASFDAFKHKDYTGLYDEQEADYSIPWNLSLAYNMSISKPTPDIVNRSSSLSLNLSLNLTKHWKIALRGNYDFEDHEVSAPQVTINRDLHCWEMNFTWNPLGVYRGFRFEIRIKAPELRDLKVTKSSGLYSGR